MAVAAHWYAVLYPPAERMQLLSTLMLLMGCVVGLFCLGLIPVVVMVRRAPPPTGILIFAAMVSIAPWLGIFSKLFS